MHSSTDRALAFGAAAAVAAAGFGAVAAASARRATAHVDRALVDRAGLPRRHPARRVVNAPPVAGLGKWYGYLPVALGIAAAASTLPHAAPRRRRAAGAGAIVAAGALSFALTEAMDRALPQPPVPPGRRNRKKPVFPSGHTFGPTAVGTAGAWVLARDGVVHPAAALALALGYPALAVAGRLMARRHWASDVLGGWLGGVAVACACLAAAESGE